MFKIKQSVVNGIMGHVRREAPIEACGYLAEKDGIVVRHYELTNMDQSEVHFTMDPAEQFEAVRRMRSEGLRLRAVYHSHPETPARPSMEDHRLARDRNLTYVIVSLLDDTMESFRLKNAVLEKKEIEIIN